MILQISVNDFAHEALSEGGFMLRCRSCGCVMRCGAGEKTGVMLHAAACRTLAGIADIRTQIRLVLFNLPRVGLVEIQHDVLAS